ncbi:ribonuclease P protein component [Zavarzinia marina]|uniref:ribonuclease P protein component n=1 Tax=Zavarzinia marina TaxID=2911065 RepID=UPI0022A8D178|nr:ribonuclease P protein component [Zavarzinia marina]
MQGPASEDQPQPQAGPAQGTVAPLRLVRLKTRQEFLAVAGARRKFTTPGLMLQAMARPDSDPAAARVGFTASRKVGNAVTRNRAKRRLRALAADVVARRAQGGIDYVLIARQETATRSFALLREDLTTALGRLRLLREARP